jgi:anaerobic selenocysteine-containing dehydrogenase
METMSATKYTYCRICEPHCSLIAEFDAQGKLCALHPDRSHPAGGIACHKGLSFLDVHNDPDRLNWPIRRTNPRSEERGNFEETDWDSAMADIGARLSAIRDQHGPNAIAFYLGNPFALASSTGWVASESLAQTIGTRSLFGSNTQDAANKIAAAGAIYGSLASLMVPDLRNTDYLLCIGGNPKVSRWTVMSTPNDDLAVLHAIRNRGGKVRFLNPRQTESSTDETGPTIRIKPGTDVYFLAALLNEIERQDGFEADAIAVHGKRIDELKTFVRLYPAERVAGVTGISADVVAEVARDIIAAPSAVVYMATGVNQSRQGLLSYWLVEMINFMTGNLGRKGGSYKPTGTVEYFAPAGATMNVETSLGPFELPDPIGYSVMPAAILPALIRNGDIRAMLVLGANPLLSMGAEFELREAVEKLDLMISIDLFRQATGELCDYVLPATDFLEHMDLNILSNGMQLKPYVQYTDAMEAPAAGRRNGWWILARILQSMGLPSPLDANPDADDGHEMVAGMLAARGLTAEALKALPSNTQMLEPDPFDSLYTKCLQHPDGKIDCCPPAFEAKGLFARCQDIFEELSSEPENALKLISLRTRYAHNSWMVNTPKFRRGANSINPLNMAGADAAARGLYDGDTVRVFNAHGSIEAQILIDDNLRTGVVAMTHGYGHQKSYGLKQAQRKPGVNCNILMPVGTDNIEPISYMSWISAVPVEVERVEPA